MDFRALIVTEDESYHYKELEESLMSIDFEVEFLSELESSLSWVSNSQFKYDIFFILKEPAELELPAVSSLSRMKTLFVMPDSYALAQKSKKSDHWLNPKGIYINEELKVVDEESNLGSPQKVVISGSSMRYNQKFFDEVERVVALNPYHLSDSNWDTVIHGNRTTKALMEDLVFRTGKDVTLAVRKENMMVFSCDIFSNEAIRAGDNARFIGNAVEIMLKGADIMD
ncbi:MAG: hypothetical protein ACLFO6_07125 [Archaeoglobaceae archaeon]